MFFDGDVVSVRCDTVYVLNKLTFKLYNGAYTDVRKKGASISGLTSAYGEIVDLQGNRIQELESSMALLRKEFGLISSQANTTLAESTTRLTLALTSLDGLNKDLIETKRLLGDAKGILETEKNWLNMEKLLWGVGGVAVGIVVGTFIAK